MIPVDTVLAIEVVAVETRWVIQLILSITDSKTSSTIITHRVKPCLSCLSSLSCLTDSTSILENVTVVVVQERVRWLVAEGLGLPEDIVAIIEGMFTFLGTIIFGHTGVALFA